jgi:hypothetical protein
MAKLSVSFEAETAKELRALMLSWLKTPASAAQAAFRNADIEAPSDPEDAEDAETLSDEDYDAKHPVHPAKPKKARAALRAINAAPPPPPEPESEPELEPVIELPPLDALKSVVVARVKQDQSLPPDKQVILKLLPAFKDKTGLTFVMSAEEKHRKALYDLCLEAGLAVA